MRNYDENMNVLIVDDRPENILALESILEGLPLKIFTALSGNDALALMFDTDFSLVLLDVQMPEMNGFEVAELMRSCEKTRSIPIIFVTAINKEQKYVFKGYELGAVDYLFKPIEPLVLKSKIKVFIEIYKQKNLLQKQAYLLEQKIEELIRLRESNFELQKLSAHDSLTDIPNRRGLDEFLDREWRSAIRDRYEMSAIMVDIDFFKRYNDTYGHLEGDECLKKVAQALKNTLRRPKDFVARYGGEEFVVALPNTDLEGAIFVAENLRKSIEALAIPHETSTLSSIVTISLGVHTVLPTRETSFKNFMDEVDQALYLAKQAGRNRVCTYTEGETSQMLA